MSAAEGPPVPALRVEAGDRLVFVVPRAMSRAKADEFGDYLRTILPGINVHVVAGVTAVVHHPAEPT